MKVEGKTIFRKSKEIYTSKIKKTSKSKLKRNIYKFDIGKGRIKLELAIILQIQN